ncbi:MAG: FtsX-like permease family protein [Treponema sp.]|jgi:putative ABC transport system permease protein|nr:FtsX-like permease family protein [Treponema sp.]
MNNKYRQGGTGYLIKIAYRNIWRNKRRTGFVLMAIGISAFFFLIFMSMQDGIIRSMNDTVQVYEPGHIKVVSVQYEAENENMPVQYPVEDGKNWKEIADSIRRISGVRAVFPRITALATLQESTVKHAILWGIDIEAETALNHLNFANRDNGLVQGRYPAPEANECAIGTVFARKAGLSIGDRIPFKTLSAQFSDRIWSPIITGIFNFDYHKYDENVIIADFRRTQRLLTLYEGTQKLVIFVNDETESKFIAGQVQNILGKDSAVTDWNDNYWIAIQKTIDIVYMGAYLAFLIVASFMIINTVTMIIHERIKEIGMMGCLGMTRAEIVKVFFFESLFLAAIGALFGVIAGGVLSGILSNFPIRLGDMYGNTLSEAPVSGTVFFRLSFVRIIQAWLIGVVIASIFTLIPSLKSAFVESVEALRK